jgi:tetratricopeptide (TPR) repeat protein
LELQQLDKAIASIERAVLINPRLNGYYRLGLAYQAKGDKPKAIAALQQALSLNLNGKAAEDARKRLAELGV